MEAAVVECIGEMEPTLEIKTHKWVEYAQRRAPYRHMFTVIPRYARLSAHAWAEGERNSIVFCSGRASENVLISLIVVHTCMREDEKEIVLEFPVTSLIVMTWGVNIFVFTSPGRIFQFFYIYFRLIRCIIGIVHGTLVLYILF